MMVAPHSTIVVGRTTHKERMQFPAQSLKQAIEAFTEAAYGERLTFEHP